LEAVAAGEAGGAVGLEVEVGWAGEGDGLVGEGGEGPGAVREGVAAFAQLVRVRAPEAREAWWAVRVRMVKPSV
jgi:hypothetical protein